MFDNFNSKVFLVVLLIMMITTVPVFRPITATASDFVGQLFKTFGIGLVVDKFAEPINNFINTLTLNNGVKVKEQTKVVPIVTVGSNSYAGAVQVSGPGKAVAQVEAVAQLEGSFKDGDFRVRALIPINTKNPIDIQNIERIEGVGVTALIDIDI